MKSILVLTILSALYTPLRPPEPPVPFPYDPALVNYEIIEAIQYDGTGELWFTRKIVEPEGQSPTLSFSDPGIVINPPVVTDDPDDPDKKSKIYTYQCFFPQGGKPSKTAIYVDVTAADNDPIDPKYDHRTMIFWLGPLPLPNQPPVIR